jgi:hypothetical protein
MPRRTERINLISPSPGTERFVNVHYWGNPGEKRAYIQASLHADEIPGLVVAHHLTKLLDEADKRNEILGEIVIVPFANPIGLSQSVFDSHFGRFCLENGTNFNRSWPDMFKEVAARVDGKLENDSVANVKLIRDALLESLKASSPQREDEYLKYQLQQLAGVSDIALDLHCDSIAVMHMYTHTRLWPEQMSDLACHLGSRCNIIDENSGGNCFDETLLNLWAQLADKFPQYPIPMACHAATVELRGEHDVSIVKL